MFNSLPTTSELLNELSTLVKDSDKVGVSNGEMCLKDSNCKSGWCKAIGDNVELDESLGNYKCKEKNEFMGDCSVCLPLMGTLMLCNQNVNANECKDGLHCDGVNVFGNGGKCQWNYGSRKIDETCNQNKSCEGAGTFDGATWVPGTGEGTACCQGKCAQKIKDWTNTYYCPSLSKISP